MKEFKSDMENLEVREIPLLGYKAPEDEIDFRWCFKDDIVITKKLKEPIRLNALG